MQASDWTIVAATMAGPLIAVQTQKWIERARERSSRKLQIFRTLMATRLNTIAPAHVEALNLIDIEFRGKNERELNVREAWATYLNHLCAINTVPDEQRAAQMPAWQDKRAELLVDLLQHMAKTVGYHFDRVHLLKNAYSPQGHVDYEWEQLVIRRMWLQVLAGERTVGMDLRSAPGPDPEIVALQKKVLELQARHLAGELPVMVKLAPESPGVGEASEK